MISYSLFTLRPDHDSVDDCITMIGMTLQLVAIFGQSMTDIASLNAQSGRAAAISVASSAGCEETTLEARHVERHTRFGRPCARIRQPRFLHIFVNRMPVTG
jgi:conjugal transfer/entry exclusion protein